MPDGFCGGRGGSFCKLILDRLMLSLQFRKSVTELLIFRP
jgi:hypothetical protein